MAGTPFLFLTQTTRGRVLVEGFPDPNSFFGTALPSTHGDVKEVQPGEERRGGGSIKLQPHQTPTNAITPRGSDVPNPPDRGDSTERRDTGRGLLNQEALFTQ